MENYSYTASYPDSRDSSPRSRDIDFENPPPWEDQTAQPPPNYKVKFMCSYGGKITPRPHDNQLSYVGGETKIMAVDRGIKFSGMISKLSSLIESDVCFKYQLPGEDLDALISVTNDDDLEHMMHEYDRLFRASAKPARMRLFLFPGNRSEGDRFGSGDSKSEKERFVEALNSGPVQDGSGNGNADFLFGLDKGPPIPAPNPILTQPPVKHQAPVHEPEIIDRFLGSDPMQKLQIGAGQQRNDDSLNYRGGGGGGGEFYAQNIPEKLPQVTVPLSVPAYWPPPEKQVPAGGGYTMATNPVPDQQVYMMHTPSGTFHAQMRPPNQGYYAVPRMAPEQVYRDPPPPQQQHQQQPQPQPTMYNVVPQPKMTMAAPATGYPDGMGMGMVRPNSGGVVADATGYTQVGYDSSGRAVYYTTAPSGGVVQPPPQQTTPYQGQEGKMVVTKVTQTSV